MKPETRARLEAEVPDAKRTVILNEIKTLYREWREGGHRYIHAPCGDPYCRASHFELSDDLPIYETLGDWAHNELTGEKDWPFPDARTFAHDICDMVEQTLLEYFTELEEDEEDKDQVGELFFNMSLHHSIDWESPSCEAVWTERS